jgi:formate dehydrogenase iron-sulfur subunit
VAIDAVLAAHVGEPGGLLPALQAMQHREGYIDRAHIPPLAEAFNLSVAEVHGVISFYRDLRTTPPLGPVLHVCRGEACQARGGRAVWAAVQQAPEWAAVEAGEVFCLGNCARGPNVAVGEEIFPIRDEGDVEAVVRRALAPAPTARQHGRAASDAAGIRVFVPGDATARAEGADAVADALSDALAADVSAAVVRTGSRGMAWLEPLVEVDTGMGRIAYGPVAATDVASLAGVLATGGDHPLRLGPVSDLAWMRGQQRVTFARVGVVDPREAGDYEAHGGLVGLRRALSLTPAEVVAEVVASGLRGRGGAAFPTGVKWQTVLATPSARKYIVANADEGDSGTFADRLLMEGDPLSLLEGMAIAGWAVGAGEGYVYVRSEYPGAVAAMHDAVRAAEQAGWLGADVLGSGFGFRVHVRVGAGAYICGEETALLESLEGRRGVVRAKPPLPAISGLWGKPTVVNNVLTLATVPMILADGAAAYVAHGSGASRGTQVFQLAGNIACGGVVEVPFGITLRELIEGFGGGTASGRPVRAVQVGGPLGAYLSAEQLDLPADYESLAAAGAMLGHGGIVVFDDTVDMAAQARFAMEFCAIESCGKCTPCRIGSTRGVELIDRITADRDDAERDAERDADLALLADLCEVMADASLCAMGGLTPLPVRSALRHFPDDFLRGPAAAAADSGEHR